MSENNVKNSWKLLPVREKIQYSLALIFGIASVAIGFIAFIILLEIPGSVIGISALWASVACGILGITLHFRNAMVEFQTDVKKKMKELDNELDEKLDKRLNHNGE